MRGWSKAAARQRQHGSWLKSPPDSAVYPSAVCSSTGTYGVVYFYNVIVPPAATTPLKRCACWGKNSVARPAHPDTAEPKQRSWGLGNTDNSTAPPRAKSSEAPSTLGQNSRSHRTADWTRTPRSCPPEGANRSRKRNSVREEHLKDKKLSNQVTWTSTGIHTRS